MTLLSLLWMLGDQTPIGKALFLWLPGILRSTLYAEPAMAAFLLGMAILAGLGAHQLLASRRVWMGAAAVADRRRGADAGRLRKADEHRFARQRAGV